MVVADGGAELEDVHGFQVIDEGDGVGDAGIEDVDGRVEALDGDGRVESEVEGIGHGDLDLLTDQPRGESSGDGFEGDDFPGLPEQAGGVAAEAAGPVATHFGLPAVGIVVAKLEVGPVLGGFGSQQSIRPHPAMTVADPGDLLAGELDREVAVVDHHEVVSGSVHLGEGETHDQVVR